MAANITITGRLGRDPETRTAGSSTVVELSVASTHRANVGGEWQEVTTWYRASVWGKRDQGTVERFAAKGSYVVVSGTLEPREYKAKDGAAKLSLEINASSVEVPRMGDAAARAPQQASSSAAQRSSAPPPDDGDLPF